MSFLKKYLVFYTGGVVLLTVFLKWYEMKRFNPGLLDQMLTDQGKFKAPTTDPCQYLLSGEPETPGQYVKLTFKCSAKEARDTLDFGAIRNKTVGGAIEEVFRINGVSYSLARLKCSEGGREVF